MQVAEWQGRAEKFEEMCCSVIQMFARLSNSANRTILYDLYPYIWDIKSIISMVKSFVQWLGMYDWDHNMLTLRALAIISHVCLFSETMLSGRSAQISQLQSLLT